VPACGWSDLGTPRRVGEAVNRYRSKLGSSTTGVNGAAAFLDLTARHAQLTAVA
jgi:hypothetical protein